VASGSPEQLSVFIHRAVAYHGGVVQDGAALDRIAAERCSNPGQFNLLLAALRRAEWISWPGLEPIAIPGLQRSVSTHLETPTNAGSSAADELMPSASNTQGSPSGAAPLPSEAADHPMACPVQALQGHTDACPAGNAHGDFFPSAEKGKSAGYDADKLVSEAEVPAPSTDQALAGVAQEAQLDDRELCSTPFSDFGPLVVTAPPWAPANIFSSRMFSLVLLNPRNPRTGLILMSSTSQSLVTQSTQGILLELGQSAAALGEPSLYDTLLYDPAMLAAIAASSGDGASGLQQLLGGVTGSFSNEASNSTSAPASASASASAPAGLAHEPHPEEEHGECPICFEDIASGDAAMRCSGAGGIHHYFHATCLQQWIRQCRDGQAPTCPVCRGTVQFNGQRLETFLHSPNASNLGDDERSFLQNISDGLQHKNAWSDMSTVEKGAFSIGIAAAAGWGFMLGYNGDGQAAHVSNQLVIQHLGREHQIAQGVGWVAGLLARIIREATKERSSRRDSRDGRH